ncbi:hypothetical protein N9N28_10800 [Rubripirellula amarantea]|nr:hypothetical protein [Rubripirellula amarantea]
MRSRLLTVLLALILISAWKSSVRAADPIVRINTDPAAGESLVVGQRIRLMLDVLDSEGWANVPHLPSVKVSGAVVYVPDGQATRLTETIKGESYTGQRNEWWVYPQRAQPLMVPPINVDIEVNNFGAKEDVVTKTVSTQPVSLEAKLPEGVASTNGWVVAESFDVTQSWEPNADGATFVVGDGIVRTIRRTIKDAPAMMMPAIKLPTTAGTKMYPKAAETSESNNRGELEAIRVDRTTYVFTRPGSIEVPPIDIVWWSSSQNKMINETLPGQTFQVSAAIGDSGSAAAHDTQKISSQNRRWFGVGVVVLTLMGGALSWWIGHWALLRRRTRQMKFSFDPLPPLNP